MKDSASGPSAGYVFQYEIAVLHLAGLKNSSDFITIENVDDVAVHDSDGTVVITIQAKNSICSSGTTFQNTSYALWRTLQIWLEKIEGGEFNNNTIFTCATNKEILSDSLLRKFTENSFDDCVIEIEALLQQQENKLKQIQKGSKSGKSISKTIQLLKYALSKKESLKHILNNIRIEDKQDIYTQLSNALFLDGNKISKIQRDSFIESLIGWVVTRSKYKWQNHQVAKFSKTEFNEKYNSLRNTSSIMNAIFREKRNLGNLAKEKIDEKRSDLFVVQIEDLDRRLENKEIIIDRAIQDFLYFDIEFKYIIDRGNYTSVDFDNFENECFNEWRNKYTEIVRHESSKYTSEQLNDLGVQLFDHIMLKPNVKFNQDLIKFMKFSSAYGMGNEIVIFINGMHTH